MPKNWNMVGSGPGRTYSNTDGGAGGELEHEWTLQIDVKRPPVLWDSTIVVSCQNRQVKAFDLDGRGLWSYAHPDDESAYDVSFGYLDGPGDYTTVPAVSDGSVYHVANDRCVALDLDDGTEEWYISLPAFNGVPMYGVLLLDDIGNLYVSCEDGLQCIDSETGAITWSKRSKNGASEPTVTEAGDMVVYKDGYNEIRALDVETGRSRWTYTEREADPPGRGEMIHDSRLLLNHFNVPAVRALNLEDGALEWSLEQKYSEVLPHRPTNLLFAISDESLDAIDLVTGAIRWTVELAPEESGMRGGRDSLYLANGERIVRRDSESGVVRDRSPALGCEITDFVVGRGRLAVIGQERLALLSGDRDSDTGDTEVWSDGTTSSTGGETSVYDGSPSCPNCGTGLGRYDDADFCPNCGKSLSS